jgi:hypothetical protein
VPHVLQQKGVCTESQLFVSVLDDSIPMMRTYTAEGDLLIFVIYRLDWAADLLLAAL